jgi:hypothetical protein
LSEEQTPHIVEKPKNRRDAMEPKQASCGLHTQEVAGSSPAAPTIKINRVHGFIDRDVNLVIGNILGLFCASIQERFEASCDRGTIPGRRDLLRRNSHDVDFFIGVNRPVQQLLDIGFQAWWQLAGFLNRDSVHIVPSASIVPSCSAELGKSVCFTSKK